MYEFWHDYLNPKYGEKTKLYYTDTDNFPVYVKTNDICKDIAENVETGFDKVISAMKDELTVCSYHVTYAFQGESTLYSCLNIKELLARSRREI